MLWLWIGIIVALVMLGLCIIQAFRSKKPLHEPFPLPFTPPPATPRKVGLILRDMPRSEHQVAAIHEHNRAKLAKPYVLPVRTPVARSADAHLGAREDSGPDLLTTIVAAEVLSSIMDSPSPSCDSSFSDSSSSCDVSSSSDFSGGFGGDSGGGGSSGSW